MQAIPPDGGLGSAVKASEGKGVMLGIYLLDYSIRRVRLYEKRMHKFWVLVSGLLVASGVMADSAYITNNATND